MSSFVGDSNSISNCAACGKAGDNLKACTACHLVKYCNRECQISHRPKHKKECRKRAAELRRTGGSNTSSNSNVNEISEGIGNVSVSGSTGKKTSTSYEQNQKQNLRSSSGAINSNSISDEELFRDPPKREECQICYLPMPFSNDVCGVKRIYMTCCGKVFCSGCVLAESEEMNKGNIKGCAHFVENQFGFQTKYTLTVPRNEWK